MSPALQFIVLSFVLTLVSITLLAKLARRAGLVDEPDHRKRHQGDIPIVGGAAIMLTFLISAACAPAESVSVIAEQSETLWIFLIAASLITALGVVDDYRGMSVFTRVLCEVAIALFLIERLELLPRNLGDLVGGGDITMPRWIAYPFTVVAIFGVVNAYNMLDGIDGLLATMVLITVFAFHLFSGLEPGFITLTLAASLSAFLVSNLGMAPLVPKSFLGDAGSKLLGFIVVSLILTVTTERVGGAKYIEPVTALYLVALPLFDMTFVTVRRLMARTSAFSADRTHIHHLLEALDISTRRAVLLISCMYLGPAFVGLMLDRSGAAIAQQFYIFLSIFITYCLFMSQAWRIARRYQMLKESADKSAESILQSNAHGPASTSC